MAYESEEDVPEAAKAVPETNHVAPVSSVEDGERPPTAPNSPVLPESTTGKKKEEEKAQEEGQIEVKGEKEVGAKRKEPEEAEGPQKDGQQKRARTGSPSGTLTFSRRLSQFERSMATSSRFLRDSSPGRSGGKSGTRYFVLRCFSSEGAFFSPEAHTYIPGSERERESI